MRKLVSESLNEYMDNFERGGDPKRSLDIGEARWADLAIENQDWLEEESEARDIDVIEKIKNLFPKNDKVFWVAYDYDPVDEDEENRRDKVLSMVDEDNPTRRAYLSDDKEEERPGGDLSVFEEDDIIIASMNVGYGNNWFANREGIKTILQ